MTQLTIGPTGPRPLDEWSTHEITQQLVKQRKDRESVCVMLQVDTQNCDFTLRSTACPSSGGGSRPPLRREKKIIELWSDHGLDEDDFSPGNLVSFIKQFKNKYC